MNFIKKFGVDIFLQNLKYFEISELLQLQEDYLLITPNVDQQKS